MMARPRYMYTAAKRRCKIFRDSLMFCYGSCSLAQTLIDRLVDQRRDHPEERGEFERFVYLMRMKLKIKLESYSRLFLHDKKSGVQLESYR